MEYFRLLFVGFSILLIACTPAPPVQDASGSSGDEIVAPSEVEDQESQRKREKRREEIGKRYSRTRSPFQQGSSIFSANNYCHDFGKDSDVKCKEDEICAEVCDDFFSGKDESKCLESPVELVYEFDILIESLDDGDVEDVEPEILDCLLEIDDGPFTKELRRLSSREAKEFLELIAEDEDLAEVMEDQETSNYTFLTGLLSRSGSSNLLSAENNFPSFLNILIEEDNEGAWDWFNSYVEDYKSNPLEFYCHYYTESNSGGRKEHFRTSSLFEDAYGSEIEDDYTCFRSNTGSMIKAQAKGTTTLTGYTLINTGCVYNDEDHFEAIMEFCADDGNL